MRQIISLFFILSFYCLKAQDSTRYIILDTLEKQLDIFKENERVLLTFKESFNEKSNLMITKFQKNYEDFLKWYERSCPTIE